MTGKSTFWARIGDLVTGSPERVSAPMLQPIPLTERGVRLPLDGHVLEVDMGTRRLHLSPDLAMTDGSGGYADGLMVFEPDRFYGRIGHFARLSAGETMQVNPRADAPERLFVAPSDALRSGVRLRHDGETLVVKAAPDLKGFVTVTDESARGNRILAERRLALECLGLVAEGIVSGLSQESALTLLRDVNRILERDPYRARASDGRIGGIVEIPAHKTPILVGDLHGQIDNLITLLCQNDFLECLEREEAALVFLGDAVHREDPDGLEDMASSMMTMDLIFRLKTTYPEGVFFLIGNHDGFSPDLMKNGVPQGMLWERSLHRRRGREYLDEMRRFYSLCPLVAVSDGYVACHAGPPRVNCTRQMLVDVRRHATLLYQLIWNRQATIGVHGGYTGADVRRFLRVLGVGDDAVFVVGHYPRSETSSVWLDAGGIEGHHVIISSRREEVAVLTSVDGEFVAQVYGSERLAEWLANGPEDQLDGVVSEMRRHEDRPQTLHDPC